DAIGGIGDWYLANDRIEVIVDDPGRRHSAVNHGGTLVDAGVRSVRGEDQLGRIFPLLNLDQRVQPRFDAARAELDPAGRYARIVVSGRRGLDVIARDGTFPDALNPLIPAPEDVAHVHPETVYEVRPGEPFVRITTTLRNEGEDDAPLFVYGDIWMRGGRSMRAFVGDTLSPQQTTGFEHAGFDRDAILRPGSAMASSTFVAMAGLPPFPPVAYAIAAPERAARGRRQFGLTGEHITLMNAFVSDDGWQEVGLARVAGATFGAIPAGESFVFGRRFYVSAGGDVASLTDEIFPALGFASAESGIQGRVEPPGTRASVLIESDSGHPVTQARVAPSGRYRAVVPPGRYALVIRAEHEEPRRVAVTVSGSGFAEAPTQAYHTPARLEIPRAFRDGGPGRLVVVGIDGTPNPVFQPELVDFRIAGRRTASGTETRSLAFVGGPADPRSVLLPPGRYRIVASRGPEFAVDEAVVELADPGASLRLEPFEVPRVIALPGRVSADLHVHAEASDDSGMDNRARLAGYVAEHVDVMVTTDHDHLGWFEPALDALGVRERIRVVQGVEVTSSAPSALAPWTIGHHNAWPVPYRPLAHRKGAPPSQGLGVADLYALLRREYGARVVQLNHALDAEAGVNGEGLLNHLGTVGESYDPSRPIDTWPNRVLLETAADGVTRAVDFDAMEVMNGNKFGEYQLLREAWYSLLRQGLRPTATGNSDTHGPGQVAAYPRNYVKLAGDRGAEALDAAIREGRLFATTGPLITRFEAGGGSMGDLIPAVDGTVALRVAVAAAPWVPVDEVRVLVDGELARRFRDLRSTAQGLRLDERLELTVRRDAFLTVEAGVPLETDRRRWLAEHEGPYAIVASGFVPQAISNPIWLDADGDGAFTPPGLPETPRSDESDGQLRWTLGLIAMMTLVWLWLRRKAGQLSSGASGRSARGGPRDRPRRR
ncbi:MAG: CehA/McbA family metallohydrolase, partial [Myxococcota bacterium]